MATVTHAYVAGCTVTPAAGTTVTPGTYVTVRATPTDPANPVTLLLLNGVDYAEFQYTATPPAYLEATILIPAAGLEIGAICTYTLPGVPDFNIILPHIIYYDIMDSAPQQPSSLIFPSGNWMFSAAKDISWIYFSLGQLLAAGKQKVPGQLLPVIWARMLTAYGRANYGLIDTGVPVYIDRTADYGGGQVAHWKEFLRFDYPWKNTTVANLIGWMYNGDAYAGDNYFLENLCVGVQSWSDDAVNGGWEDSLPARQADPRTGSVFGIPAGAIAFMPNPYGVGKMTQDEIYTDFKHMDSDGSTYVNTPQGKKKFYHLYHTLELTSTITPDDGTLLMEGQSVFITAIADAGNTLSLFSVDGVDALALAQIYQGTGANYYIKTNVQADVYVSSSAEYVAPEAIDGTPYTLQVVSDICGTKVWTATDLPPGLTIDSGTGVVSGTVPYDTPTANYDPTIILTNDGRVATRKMRIPVTFAATPVPGTVWTAITKLDSEVTALAQAANGDVLIGTDAKKIYSTSDFVTFTPVFSSAASIAKIILLASGRVIALGSSAAPDCAAYSDDDGATWTKVATGGGEDYRDGVELSASLFIAAGGSGGDAYTMSSVDEGEVYTGWWSYYSVGLLNGFSKVIKFDATSLLGLRDRGSFSVIKCSGGGVAGTLKYTVAGSDGTNPSCNFVKRSDGQFLFGAYNELHIGTADGETWALHKTLPDWGGIATPGMAYSMVAENAEQAVWVAVVGGLGITHVLRSVDDGENFVASVTDIDGAEAWAMIQLANRTLILGTNGTTSNLWKSEL